MTRIIIAVMLGLSIAACGSDTPAEPAPDAGADAPESAVEATAEPEPTEEPAAEPQWVEVFRVEGDSIKDTESFTIAENEWRVSWDTQPGQFGDMNFIVTIMTADGGMHAMAANVIGASADSTVQRGAGDYYLSINSAQPYTIVVEEKR